MNKRFFSFRISRGRMLELAVWIALYGFFAVPMALGDTNGIGYFQQPKGISLWAPLALGGAVNAAIIYLHAYSAMSYFLQRGLRVKYLPALAFVIIAYLAAHLVYQLVLASTLEPSLQRLSVIAWTIENLKALPVVLLLSVIYRFGRDWIMHMSSHHALAQRTTALEEELRLVKQEFADFKNGGVEALFLRFESSRQKIQIPISAIQYVKSAGNYIEINTSEKTHTVYGAIKELIYRLPPDAFSRIHRSYVVNLNCISALNGQSVEIAGVQLPIGDTHKAALMQKWNKDERRAPSDAM